MTDTRFSTETSSRSEARASGFMEPAAGSAPGLSGRDSGGAAPRAAAMPAEAAVRWFDSLSLGDLPEVGGKNASLGELTQSSGSLGISVPFGFAIPAGAFRFFLEQTGLRRRISSMLAETRAGDLASLQKHGALLRAAVLETPLPPPLEESIRKAYGLLCGRARAASAGLPDSAPPAAAPSAQQAPHPPQPPSPEVPVAVRSSATAEDLPEASFAGAQESFLNVTGGDALVEACRRCFASLYTDRAIHYRAERGFGEESVALSVGVQLMVNTEHGASGVLFTIDTETGCRDVVLVNAVRGQGDALVQGRITPDEYLVFKPTLFSSPRPILHKRLGSSRTSPIDRGDRGDRGEKQSEARRASGAGFVLDDDTLLQIAKWGCSIESHYSRVTGRPVAMDIEWAWEGPGHQPAILQARPETVHALGNPNRFVQHTLLEKSRVLARGVSIGTGIACGTVKKLRHPSELNTFSKGDILVAEHTDPDWEPVMRLAAGIVTERGGRTCHAAIVSRELGVPAIVGAAGVMSILEPGSTITINCAAGETGEIYEGRLQWASEQVKPRSRRHTKTRLLLNLSDPAQSFQLARLPAAGVGLIREEFILAGEIGVHPLALLHPELLSSGDREQVASLITGYRDGAAFFVGTLAQGIGRIAAAFYPRPVLLRLSDLKTNEYSHLIGGKQFEAAEENPMLGFRGASRYCHPDFREAFSMECEAIKRVRQDMGLDNAQIMVPFCRTPAEGSGVLKTLATNGLIRGREGLEVWMMCEIPSNVLLAREFCGLFDGFSIGSNDLTQLTLGVDRDSERLASVFDEQNPAVKMLISQFLAITREMKKPVGICGQAPSDFPDFVRFLVSQGIDSISLDPGALFKTEEIVAGAESLSAGGAAFG